MITVHEIDTAAIPSTYSPTTLIEIAHVERAIDVVLMREAAKLSAGSEAHVPLGRYRTDVIADVLVKYRQGGGWHVVTTTAGAEYTAVFRRGRTDDEVPVGCDPEPLPMILHCPWCGDRHIDRGEFATKVHHTHACQSCGEVWRPAVAPTVGVQFLPGFRDTDDNRRLVPPAPGVIIKAFY